MKGPGTPVTAKPASTCPSRKLSTDVSVGTLLISLGSISKIFNKSSPATSLVLPGAPVVICFPSKSSIVSTLFPYSEYIYIILRYITNKDLILSYSLSAHPSPLYPSPPNQEVTKPNSISPFCINSILSVGPPVTSTPIFVSDTLSPIISDQPPPQT